jgi:hypothetical protein
MVERKNSPLILPMKNGVRHLLGRIYGYDEGMDMAMGMWHPQSIGRSFLPRHGAGVHLS